MTTQEIAARLVELCRTGQYDQAHNELYAKDVVSLEPAYTPQPEVRGIEAVHAKGKQWGEMIAQVHGGHVSEPQVAGNHISFTLSVDASYKDGKRETMEEVCVYEVKDGKIVKEQFFY